jgi:hypothetical protein
MSVFLDESRDVMVVCHNGHVLTDRLRDYPELQSSRCEKCGAPSLCRCPTCGLGLPGATPSSGLVTVGQRQPPRYCSACGAAFPWVKKFTAPPGELLASLEKLLRRLPRTVRELKLQAGARPPFRLDEERDLEYLLRAVLPLCCDEVRLLGRTPAYSDVPRTDFLLMPDRIAVTSKLVASVDGVVALADQVREDVSHYARQHECKRLVVFVLDLQGLLHEPEQLEMQWSAHDDGIDVRCVIAR